MQIETFHRLLTLAGQEALRAAQALEPREEDFLRDFQALTRRYNTDLARAALEIAIAQRKAAEKFPFAGKLYFTREALEQASGWVIAIYRAERFRLFERLADLGCSVGSDSLALAGVAPTVGFDLDGLRLRMARANASAMGLGSRAAFAEADLHKPLPLSLGNRGLALFFDPGRRAGGKRLRSVREYEPPLIVIRDWLRACPALGVKISPGVKLAEVDGLGAEIEFISLAGELKEAVLWFGPLKTAERRATLLPGAHTLTEAPGVSLEVRQPGAYLYEPDPAVLRSGLVQTLGGQLGAWQIDKDIAYLSADHLIETPFARHWAVADWFPFSLKRLRAYLREMNVGRVTVKKRGSPLQPEELIRQLRLEGDEERVLFLTHVQGRAVVVVGR
jgi:THUMP domain-like